MAIIDVPTGFGFSEVTRFQLVRASNQMRSKFTGARQVLVYPFAIWQLEAKLVEADGAKAGRFRSFLAQLNGVANKFRLPVPGYFRPSTGFPDNLYVVAEAEVRAKSLVVRPYGDGSNPTYSNRIMLRQGDYFTINDELKIVTEDVAIGGPSGTEPYPAFPKAVINFEPALRKPVGIESVVIIQNPTILMHSDDDDAATWNLRPPFRQNTTFSASEAIEL